MKGLVGGNKGRKNRWQRLGLALGAVTLIGAGTALAVGIGLQNPGFENGFGSWVVKVDRPAGNGIPGDNSGKPNRQVVYGPGGSKSTVVPCQPGDRYGICVVTGDDVFTLDGTGQTKTVSPRYGSKMVRLGGPFTNPYQRQHGNHSFTIEQSFIVDQAAPIVRLRHKLYSYDNFRTAGRHHRFDRLLIEAFDSNGHRIRSRYLPTYFDNYYDNELRATRWLKDRIHLGQFVGDQVTLRISLTGSADRLGGSWAYIDAATEPPKRPTLTVSIQGTGTGLVTGAGISCPPDCSEIYQRGTAVVLSAAPSSSSTFGGFSGACTNDPCTVTVDTSKQVTATFTARSETPITQPTQPTQPGPGVDTTAPKVVGLKGPKGKVQVSNRHGKAKVEFKFGTDEPGSQFECSLDKSRFAACSSPFKAKLKVGKHTFRVRAIDAAGNTGPVQTQKVKVKVKKH